MVLLSHTLFTTLHPFQTHSLLITIKSQNQNVLPLFHSHNPCKNLLAIAPRSVTTSRSRSLHRDRDHRVAIASAIYFNCIAIADIAPRSKSSRRDRDHRVAIAITASRSRSSRRDRDHRAAIAITSPRSRSPRRYRGRD